MYRNTDLEKRLLRLEKLIKCESDDVASADNEYSNSRQVVTGTSNYSSDSSDNKSMRYKRSAQYICDVMDELDGRIESIATELDTLHIDRGLLMSLTNSINRIRKSASEWLDY